MLRYFGTLVCVSVAIIPVSLEAQSMDTSLEQCVAIKDPAARLACYDKHMGSSQGGNARQPSPAAAAAVPASRATPSQQAPPVSVSPAPNAADQTVGLDGKQLRSKLKALGQTTEKPAAIVSRIKSLTPRPGKLHLFVLENGQSWEQIESKWDLDIGVNDTVTITAGAMGGFFLRSENKQSVRVHRVE